MSPYLSIQVEGRVDAESTFILEKSLREVQTKQYKFILINFRKVDYLNSGGMRLLLTATKKLKALGGKLVFCSMNEDVMNIVKKAGFERTLSIYPTEEEALRSL